MTIRSFIFGATLLVLLSQQCLPAQTAQTPVQMPKRFEVYYEVGLGDESTKIVKAGSHDAFDSEQKTRLFDGAGGITYKAELTDDERRRLYEAILRNDLVNLAPKDFTNLRSGDVEAFFFPMKVGRIRLDVDGRIKEVRFDTQYGMVFSNDNEWPRLRNVLDVLDAILKSKDEKQNLPRRNAYK